MAPEFFPLVASFVAFVALSVGVLLTLLAGSGLLIWAYFDTKLRKPLRIVSMLML